MRAHCVVSGLMLGSNGFTISSGENVFRYQFWQ